MDRAIDEADDEHGHAKSDEADYVRADEQCVKALLTPARDVEPPRGHDDTLTRLPTAGIISIDAARCGWSCQPSEVTMFDDRTRAGHAAAFAVLAVIRR